MDINKGASFEMYLQACNNKISRGKALRYCAGLLLPFYLQKQARANTNEEEITDKVFIEIGLCPEAQRQDRMLGDKSILCFEPEQLGRIVIGLYGNLVPKTVHNFMRMIEDGQYDGTTFNRLLPGEFIQAGQQGSKRMGQVENPKGLVSNDEVLNSKSFRLKHYYPGTVSLSLSTNTDEIYITDQKDYRNTEFLITTGPGPVPSLDGNELVFGKVLDGMSIVAEIANVPTYAPPQRVKAMNQLASFIGDDRAQRAKRTWSKPQKAIVITNTGIM
eukprot:TRINITY_DN4029_c0_g2_i1.p1 TRINITY_DN4029_c0_g2~~TRINITY_DN4029_c0_g2_i1.p1  ORF type:complete len:274 (-),score=28.40 TRINITY_DN4029_c0_g2_i1:166-987(-)